MPLRFAHPTPEAHRTPLLIGRLLDAALVHSPEQLIVQDGGRSFTYRELRERIGRLASALTSLGIGQGDTVAVLDWDSHRYLEAYFAVPMMGAVLQTVNVRLSPEQVRFTLEHGGARVLIAHRDFLPLVDRLRGALPRVEAVVAMNAEAADAPGYEDLLAKADPDFPFVFFFYDSAST